MRNLALQLWQKLNSRSKPHPDDVWGEEYLPQNSVNQNIQGETSPVVSGVQIPAPEASDAISASVPECDEAIFVSESIAPPETTSVLENGAFGEPVIPDDSMLLDNPAEQGCFFSTSVNASESTNFNRNIAEDESIAPHEKAAEVRASDDFGEPFLLGGGTSASEETPVENFEESFDDLPDPEDGALQQKLFEIEDDKDRRKELFTLLREAIFDNCDSAIDVSSQALAGYEQLMESIQDHIDNARSFPGIFKLARRGFSFQDIYKASQVRRIWRQSPTFWLYKIGTQKYKTPQIKQWTAPDITWLDAALLGGAFDEMETMASIIEVWSREWKSLDRCVFADVADDFIYYSVHQQFSSFIKYAVEKACAECSLGYESFAWKIAEDKDFSPEDLERIG